MRRPKRHINAKRRRRRAERRGRLAEWAAEAMLRLKGYRILARRYKTPMGELDLIARRGRVIAFIEVKARGDTAQGLEAITLQKRRRSARAALAFVMRHPEIAEFDLRFDVVVVRRLLPPYHLVNAWSVEHPDMR